MRPFLPIDSKALGQGRCRSVTYFTRFFSPDSDRDSLGRPAGRGSNGNLRCSEYVGNIEGRPTTRRSPMEYKGIKYEIRLHPERHQWGWVIHPAADISVDGKIKGTRRRAVVAATKGIDRWSKKKPSGTTA